MQRSPARLAVALVAALGVALATAAAAQADTGGAVYTLTNQADGNAVAVFARAGDGSLRPAGTFPTGGNGSGGGLGNQGAIVLGNGDRNLFAVNAGSNEISSLRVGRHGLSLVDVDRSGGVKPISVTTHGRVLYVLNAGDDDTPANIVGFLIGHDGGLFRLPGSQRHLSTALPDPAQVEFDPAGDVLVVTEKGTNSIVTFRVGFLGYTSGPKITPSEGETPFGFAFDPRGHLIVSEAFGGTASALSSYDVDRRGGVETISASVPAGQERAACWVVVTDDGRFAYTTNTASGSVSSYRLDRHGALSLLDALAAQQGGSPIDAALSHGSRFLYVLNGAQSRILGYRVAADGRLTPVAGAQATGLPAGTNGLAAR